MGTIVAIEKERENVHLTLNCNFTGELKIDQSLSHNGVCLTVVKKNASTYTVTAIMETLAKSNLGLLKVGDKVNLERSMMINGRLDGHIVQGHVDQTAICSKIEESDGSWYFTFSYVFDMEKARQGYMTVEKGSATVNGVSLTVVNSLRMILFRLQSSLILTKIPIFIHSSREQWLTLNLTLSGNT